MKLSFALTLSKGIGHLAFMELRDGIEETMSGLVMAPDDVLTTEVLSDRHAVFAIETNRGVDGEEIGFWETMIREHTAACLEPGETMSIEFSPENAPVPGR